MPELVEWQGSKPDAVIRAIEHLRAGRLVIFPTESVYEVAASALAPEALGRLAQLAGADHRPTLVLAHAIETYDWLPHFRGAGVRLARRFWPGPLVLVSGTGFEFGVAKHLPTPLRTTLASDNQLALRLPDHPALRSAAMELGVPLVTAATDCTSAAQLDHKLTGAVAMALLDGQTYFGQRPSVVHVHGKEWRVERAGGLPVAEIEAAAPCHIVFVCTGNTCRSPLAQVMCMKLLADHFGCAPDDLAGHGFCVHSAGLAAMMGAEASPEAVVVAKEVGADLSCHRSQPLTMELLANADHLITMTRSHLRVLEQTGGTVAPRQLSSCGQDVLDPIGGDAATYQACATQIQICLKDLLPELLEC